MNVFLSYTSISLSCLGTITQRSNRFCCIYVYACTRIYICVCVRVCAIFILNCRDDHVAITVKQKKSIMPGVCLLK